MSTIRNAIPNVKTVTENVKSGLIVEDTEGLNLKLTIVCYKEKRNNAYKKVYLSEKLQDCHIKCIPIVITGDILSFLFAYF